MAGIAGLRLLVDNAVELGGVGRKADAAFFVENANAPNTRLAAEIANDLIERVAIVVHHLVAGTALDDVCDALRTLDHQFLRAAPLHPQVEIRKYAENHSGAEHHPQGQLPGDSSTDVQERWSWGAHNIRRWWALLPPRTRAGASLPV
jgi:hypothetical protein